jgi:hypothetical protein
MLIRYTASVMTLVETTSGETDAEFRNSVDATLQEVNPARPSWWHPYEVRGHYECRGIRFRHFYCVAGSVEAWMWSIAVKSNGLRRVIFLSDESSTIFGPPKIFGHGGEIIISTGEVTAVRPAV